MNYHISWLIYTLLSLKLVHLYELTPRNAAYCAYLSQKIFCYGGSPGDSSYDTSIHSLDISSQQAGSAVNMLLNQWTNTPAKNDSHIVTEIRYDSEFVAMPDGVNMFLEGGSNDNTYSLENKTVMYNTQTDTWEALPVYYDPFDQGRQRQIHSGSAVYLPNINCIAFYGGKELHPNPNATFVTATNQTLKNLTYSYPSDHDPNTNITESYVGFYNLTLFNLSSYTWSVPAQTNKIPFIATYQTATFHPRTGKIYFLGGFYHDSLSNDVPVPLSYSLTYDTILANWENKTLNASNGVTPSSRYLHTSTLITNTNEDIVVYGGTPTDLDLKPLPVMDYLYTLNLVTLSWTAFNPVAPVGSSGPRFYHSAILVNDGLFIMLGKPKDQEATNDILVLDVRNISSLVFSETYPLSDLSASPSSLSKGAIAGVVIGSVLAVLGTLAAIAFYLIRKKRQQSQEKAMEVDWDHIDGQFREVMSVVDPVKPHLEEPPQSPTSTNFGNTTISSSTTNVASLDHPGIRRSIYTPSLVPDLNIVKPDGAVD